MSVNLSEFTDQLTVDHTKGNRRCSAIQHQHGEMAGALEKPQDEQEMSLGLTKNVEKTEHIRTSENGWSHGRGERLSIRLLRVIVIFAIYFVLEFLAKSLTVLQFIFVAWQKRPHTGMQRLGTMIAEYMYSMWRYCTFASDAAPWPFKPWR